MWIKTSTCCSFHSQCRFIHPNKIWRGTKIRHIVLYISLLMFLLSSLSPGYTSGTAGWRRFTQWSSSTVSSPAHTSLSRCPQGRTSSGTAWWWSPSAPPNTSASLTWSPVSHIKRYLIIASLVRLPNDGCGGQPLPSVAFVFFANSTWKLMIHGVLDLGMAGFSRCRWIKHVTADGNWKHHLNCSKDIWRMSTG